MWITYRRTGSGLALMAVGLTVAVLTVAVAAFAVIAAVLLAPVALLVRAMRPGSRTDPRYSSTTPWPDKTIDADVVRVTSSADERDLVRLDTDKG